MPQHMHWTHKINIEDFIFIKSKIQYAGAYVSLIVVHCFKVHISGKKVTNKSFLMVKTCNTYQRFIC